jgi:hypothetical protein
MDALARTLHIGRFSDFVCFLTIHDLTNVPLVSGRFRVKWRFRSAVSLPSVPLEDEHKHSSTLNPITALNTRRRASSASSAASDSFKAEHPEIFTTPPGDSPQRDPARSSDSRGNSVDDTDPANADRQSAPPSKQGSSSAAASAERPGRPESKGSTPFVTLRSHNITFNRLVYCPVTIPLAKGNYLQRSELKLSIKQETHTENGRRAEEKLGHVVVDLAEWAGNTSKKPRRLLLVGSKTNALLRVSIRLEFVGGERNFSRSVALALSLGIHFLTAPSSPLPKPISSPNGSNGSSMFFQACLFSLFSSS